MAKWQTAQSIGSTDGVELISENAQWYIIPHAKDYFWLSGNNLPNLRMPIKLSSKNMDDAKKEAEDLLKLSLQKMLNDL